MSLHICRGAACHQTPCTDHRPVNNHFAEWIAAITTKLPPLLPQAAGATEQEEYNGGPASWRLRARKTSGRRRFCSRIPLHKVGARITFHHDVLEPESLRALVYKHDDDYK